MTDGTILPVAFLAFGAVVIWLEIRVLLKKDQGFGPQAVRIVGVTTVLVIAAALTTTSSPMDRLTPIIGLLGTLAGYLAGLDGSKTGQTPGEKK